MSTPSARFTLLNTRPEHQAVALTDLVKQAGGEALACPTIAIESVPIAEDDCDLAEFDKVLFISANAVKEFVSRLGFEALSAFSPQVTFYAIGQATLKAGALYGLPMQTAEGGFYDSESLLERDDLQQLQGQRILIVKGENGRDLLESRFLQRGAQVQSWILYRRVPCPLCLLVWSQFMKSPHPVVLATSLTSLAYLLEALQRVQKESSENEQAWLDWLLRQPLVVFSERIRQWAKSQGWRGKIAVVKTHSDAGIVDCIINDILQ